LTLGKTGLTRSLLEVALSSAVYNVGFYFGTSLMILYLVGLGYSPFLAGVLLATSKLIYAISMMVTGSLSDRIGRKTPIIWGFALTGAALIAMGLIADLTAEAILPGEVVYRDKGYFGVALRGFDASMRRGVRGHPMGDADRSRNRRIGSKRRPVERTFAVIKRTFNGGRVLVASLPRVRVKLVFSCFCFDLLQLCSLGVVR
jgi:hypothetical protein